MEALHSHGVIHNDPVGRNLVVFEDIYGGERVVIVDFDLAQVHAGREVVERRRVFLEMRFGCRGHVYG